jgi:5-methylcytosine-specific restriction endonuclease McrA
MKDWLALDYERARRSARRVRLRNIEDLGGKCVRCGNDDYRVLEFDHIEELRGKPRVPIRTLIRRGEVENLQILCANCHSIKTWYESNYVPDVERTRIR